MVTDKKTAVMDASSAIILGKADLHLVVAEMYNLVMPESVYHEITDNTYPAAGKYRRLCREQKIIVSYEKINQPVPAGLDRGECDVLKLYHAGHGDFVITDDGAAARYCRREKIPFINALLIPLILGFAKVMEEKRCRKAYEKILYLGRYSSRVISFADTCDREKVLQFLPR